MTAIQCVTVVSVAVEVIAWVRPWDSGGAGSAEQGMGAGRAGEGRVYETYPEASLTAASIRVR